MKMSEKTIESFIEIEGDTITCFSPTSGQEGCSRITYRCAFLASVDPALFIKEAKKLTTRHTIAPSFSAILIRAMEMMQAKPLSQPCSTSSTVATMRAMSEGLISTGNPALLKDHMTPLMPG